MGKTPLSLLFRQEKFKNILTFFCCSYCLLMPALYNGYPIVFFDTASYIYTAASLHVPLDRPVTYGLFIKITSLFGLSLWGVVWAQAFILVYFLRRICRKLLKEHYSNAIFCCIVILLTVFTSASWYVAQIMSDIFTPILVLCVLDFYLSPRLSKKQRLIYFFLIAFFMEMHNSHLLTVLLFCILARLVSLVTQNKWFIKKTLFLFVVTLFSFVSISFFNLWEGNSFRPSAGTPVFLMARMAENGILDKFLKEYCPVEHYNLCHYKDEIPDQAVVFLWTDASPLAKSGGWDKVRQEYNTIIFKTWIRPKYLTLQLFKSMEGTLRQLPQFSFVVVNVSTGSPTYYAIQEHFPLEVKALRNSGQLNNQFVPIVPFFNGVILISTTLSLLAVLALFPYRKRTPATLNWNFGFAMVLAFLVINAFVAATFSTVAERLQSRLFWLLPFLCVLFIIRFLNFKNGKKRCNAGDDVALNR
jgi:hypothetical protein